MTSYENLAGFLGKACPTGREVITRIVGPDPIKVLTSVSPNETWQGNSEDELAEVLIVAGAENTDVVYFALYAAVGSANYLPLYAKDSIRLGGIKYSDIHLKFLDSGCKAHIFKVVADGPLSGADTV